MFIRFKKIKERLILLYFKLTKNSFSEYYVKALSIRIKKNPHPTLGKNITLDGRDHFLKLKKIYKIKKKDIVLDFGCGSLRIGEYFINYLNERNYYGLDVTNIFYKFGLQRIDKKIVNIKKPNLFIINSKKLEKLAENKISLIYSIAVLMHVPPSELNSYLKKIFSLKKLKTKIFIDFLESDKSIKVNDTTWIYSRKFIINEINKIDKACSVKLNKKISKSHSKQYKRYTYWTTIRIE